MSQSKAEGRQHGLGEIVGGLASDVQDLVRGEIALACAELDEKLQRAIIAAIWLIGGAFVGFAGLVVVLQGVAALLALAVPTWAAFLDRRRGDRYCRRRLVALRARDAVAKNAYPRTHRSQSAERRPYGEGTHLMSDSTSKQDVIERDLERTRSRMDNRLSELQERLSPGQILDDLMGYFRGSEGGDFARNLMDSVRNNPLPVALTGIGITWLMASNPQPRAAVSEKERVSSSTDSRTWANHEEFDLHFRELEHSVSRQTDEDDTAYRFRVDEARGKALGVARSQTTRRSHSASAFSRPLRPPARA